MFDESVLEKLSYGVYIVSATDGKRPTGCIANCLVQLTYTTLGVSINHKNYTNSAIKKCGRFAISILKENTERNIIAVFGFSSGRNRDKFDKVDFEIKDDVPVLKNAAGYITLELVNSVELDTHTFFIGKILSGENLSNENVMTYKYYHEILKGKTPKAAPNGLVQNKMFKCRDCGYVYNGDISKEPPNYLCPVCKAGKGRFEKVLYA